MVIILTNRAFVIAMSNASRIAKPPEPAGEKKKKMGRTPLDEYKNIEGGRAAAFRTLVTRMPLSLHNFMRQVAVDPRSPAQTMLRLHAYCLQRFLDEKPYEKGFPIYHSTAVNKGDTGQAAVVQVSCSIRHDIADRVIALSKQTGGAMPVSSILLTAFVWAMRELTKGGEHGP